MRLFNLPPLCSVMLVGYLGGQVGAVSSTGPATHRMLRAATKREDLYRRGVRIAQTFQSEVSYIEDENGWSGKTTFASRVKVSSDKPILNLEDIEHHIQEVQCSNGKMKVHFVNDVSARDARFACHGNNGGLVITSHESCNKEGERAVYRVHDANFIDDGEALELTVSESSWQGAFNNFDISFGHTTDDHFFRHHSDFSKIRGKRQVDIPTNTPENVNTATFHLWSQLLDTTFPAESFIAGLQQVVPIPLLPIEIGCKNCTTHGELALTQGAFKIDVSQIDFVPDVFQGGDDGKDLTNIISGGFFELAAKNVGARLELFTRPKVSGAFEIALFKLPILGFVIPGIGQAGAAFEPRIAVNFEITGGFEMSYGIDVTIPNDSKIRVELSDIGKSSVVGFPGSTLIPLPIIANVTDADILLGLAFKPSIPIGFEFSNNLRAETTVSMDLPRLDAKLSTNKEKNCGNVTLGNDTVPPSPSSDMSRTLQALADLGPLALVEANISISVDVALNIDLPLLPPPANAIEVATAIFSTVFPLVTACAAADNFFKSMPAIGLAPTTNVYYANSTSAGPTPCSSTQSVVATSHPAWENTTTVHQWPGNPTSASQVIVTESSVNQASQSTTHAWPEKPTSASEVIVSQTPISQPSQSTAHASPENSSSASQAIMSQSSAGTPPQTTVAAPPPPCNETYSNSTVQLQTSSQAPPPVQTIELNTTSAVSPPPAPSVTESTGFLQPNGTSISVSVTQAKQTVTSSIATFTGAAVLGVQVPWRESATIGWQVSAIGISMVFGALML